MAVRRGTTGSSPANRGRALEDLVRVANARYRALGLAVVHKVPSAWVPLRGPGGRVAGAKVEEKAAVDFLGHVRLPSGSGWGVPVAFDAKEVSRGDRWSLSRLEPHQYEYLQDCHRTGCAAFVLVAFWEPGRFFALPFPELERRWEAWKAGTGPASVRAGEPGLIEVRFPDYLDFVLSAEERIRELFFSERGG